MSSGELWHAAVPLPTLLRRARATYGQAMRAALAAAGFDDVPVNGLYALGRLDIDGEGLPLSQLIGGLGISKQTAGQLVDTLVSRGYVSRHPDPLDRRKLIVALTDRGMAAAVVQRAARGEIDSALLNAVGGDNVERTRLTLAALVEAGEARRQEADRAEPANPVLVRSG